jgi:hypothetical protein
LVDDNPAVLLGAVLNQARHGRAPAAQGADVLNDGARILLAGFTIHARNLPARGH